MKIKKGDMVKIRKGRDKGKTGKVLEVMNDESLVLVEKVNLVKRHQKPNQKYRQGGIIEKETPIQVANVMFYDAKSAKAVRLGAKFDKEGAKFRVSRKSGESVEAKA